MEIRSFPFGCHDDQELPPGETAAFALASGGHWYGHGFSHQQPLPLETGSVTNNSFAVNNIQSPIWMCSAGVAILAETLAPLEVQINAGGDGLLRVRCPGAALPLRFFRGPDLPAARAALLRHLGWPNDPPAPELFGDSIFCTWTQYPRCIDQDRILRMAREIRHRGYPCTTLIVDDRWESCFGELSFAGKDFPDPRAMLAELHALGFQVWLWVTPFVNQEAATFAALSARRVLVPRRDSQGAALCKWWGGTAGLVDLTGPAGREWYRGRLLALRELGVDGFKIDGGDGKYQPSPAEADWHEFLGASGYSDALLALFAELAPNRCETRTAWLSQRRNIVWREGGKDSHWGADNGLKALLRLGLQLGLLGYDLLIPDMVPGRVQTMVANMDLPSDELMLRWTETSAFFPLLQFSYFPWNYAPATEAAVRGYALAHRALQPYLAAAARDRQAPLLRPIWFDTPAATHLYPVADEFMLGPDLVVAPVLDPAVTTRDVLLPPGSWRDAWTGQVVGDARLPAYPAPCPGLPLFVRAENRELLAVLQPALAGIVRGSVANGITTARYRAGLDRDLSVTG